MRRALSCIVQHLANAVPRKTIGKPLFCIVRHLPNVVPGRTMQNNTNPTVLLGTPLYYIAKCSTELNSGEQCNPDCFTRYAIALHLPNAEQ